MKNIHILPTENPSRLIHNEINQLCYQSKKSAKNDRKWLQRKKFNIYITSDEEIKEGDWCWDVLQNKIYLVDDKITKSFFKKIILTTDQDLIKDGVQAIDDEFLEWFIKNPSYEWVEVDFKYENCIPALDDNGNKILKIKIPSKSENLCQIIPKEESKQKWDIDTCRYWNMEIGCEREKCICENTEPKKETLEESFEKWAEQQSQKGVGYDKIDVLQFGAKWQQEQIGKSEFLQKLRGTLSDAEARRLIFEQFKKK
ncbi:hypothetical protein [Flavobacterium sp.]|uniref:hypothetical protein n=1 Tax=Flavobacterium sp. TaxID=239 RepID=UPI0025FB5CC3|nr:hypothetical protein [Flavobacterium sp.]